MKSQSNESVSNESVKASYDGLRRVAEGEAEYQTFVWSDDERLTVSRTTADIMMEVYDKLDEKQQDEFKEWITEGPERFERLIDICWDRIEDLRNSYGGKFKPAL